ncbi:MAG: hypothetical protein IKR60_00920, partial [Alphaproteobacteria bacterium]|nr:hypothetical protein [Alphaproteobacteria bacterium]
MCKPEIAKNILEYNGKYYVTNIDKRLAYKIDKTENDQCLILTLFSIAEEILYTLRRDYKMKYAQEEINSIKEIKLGVGLPPGHFNNYVRKLNKYYTEKMGEGISFKYCNYSFNFKLSKIRIFPQDFIAFFKNKMIDIPKDYDNYYIIGIGGGTVDIIPIVKKLPDV